MITKVVLFLRRLGGGAPGWPNLMWSITSLGHYLSNEITYFVLIYGDRKYWSFSGNETFKWQSKPRIPSEHLSLTDVKTKVTSSHWLDSGHCCAGWSSWWLERSGRWPSAPLCTTLPKSLAWVKCSLTAIRSHTTGRRTHTHTHRGSPLVHVCRSVCKIQDQEVKKKDFIVFFKEVKPDVLFWASVSFFWFLCVCIL